MLHLVQSSPRDFYARDRNKIINAACGLLGKEYARPLDAIEDLLTLMQYTLVRRPLPGDIRAHTHRQGRTIIVCSNLERKLIYPESLPGVMAFTVAREMGHMRLHLYQVEKLLPIHGEEASRYAGVFLVPRRDLVALPEFHDMLDAGRAGLNLWQFVHDLATHFGVTKSCMARQLEELGVVIHDRENRELRLSA